MGYSELNFPPSWNVTYDGDEGEYRVEIPLESIALRKDSVIEAMGGDSDYVHEEMTEYIAEAIGNIGGAVDQYDVDTWIFQKLWSTADGPIMYANATAIVDVYAEEEEEDDDDDDDDDDEEEEQDGAYNPEPDGGMPRGVSAATTAGFIINIPAWKDVDYTYVRNMSTTEAEIQDWMTAPPPQYISVARVEVGMVIAVPDGDATFIEPGTGFAVTEPSKVLAIQELGEKVGYANCRALWLEGHELEQLKLVGSWSVARYQHLED